MKQHDPVTELAASSGRRFGALSLLVLVLDLTGAVRADDARSPALHWSRADDATECIDPRTLAELVETYTGPVLVSPSRAGMSIEGRIERATEGGFDVHIGLTLARGRPAGNRVLQLRERDCRKLDGAIAFVIATTIDPSLGAAGLPIDLDWLSAETPAQDQLRAELSDAPAVSQPAGSAPVRPDPTPLAADASMREERPSPVRPQWELNVAATLGRGAAPKATAGALIGVGRSFGSWFSLAGQLRANSVLGSIELPFEGSLNVHAWSLAALGCARSPAVEGFSGQACLGPEVGWQLARSEGYSQEQGVYRAGYGALARLELRYAINAQLAVMAAGLFAAELGRKKVELMEQSDHLLALRAERFTLHAALGLTYGF